MLTIDLIKQAAVRIAGRVHRTPVVTSRSFNEVAGCEVFFKCENLQRAGAFKARGATNKILSLNDGEKKRGIIAVSSGNHAQAVALASREAGTRAVICLPEDAPKMKVAATRGYGADIRFFNRHKDDRDALQRRRIVRRSQHRRKIDQAFDQVLRRGTRNSERHAAISRKRRARENL